MSRPFILSWTETQISYEGPSAAIPSMEVLTVLASKTALFFPP